MVDLLAVSKGDITYQTYVSELEKEYAFWMDGKQTMHPGQSSYRRLVRLGTDEYLNRYYDDNSTPRQENYLEDIHLAGRVSSSQADFYRELRAACESGWDFSSRWCDVAGDLTTMQTTHIIPVDLNVCLLKLEKVLLKCYQLIGNRGQIKLLDAQVKKREKLIIRYFWQDQQGYFFDYDFVKQTPTTSMHAGGLFPLFGEVATTSMARQCIRFIRQKLWMKGGIVATNLRTGLQWDSPYGYAPLQWIAYKGMINYGFTTEAKELASTWTELVIKTFQCTGSLIEKYNVCDPAEMNGGEYDMHDGFGWTNGVLLALLKELRMSDQ
jgi:alpha,alpha-trehalase